MTLLDIDLVAWLRRPLVVLAALSCAVSASHIERIFTSSVSYCAPPESLLVQQFDIVYFPGNNSVLFNVSAASVETNVSVRANLALDDYGSSPVNITLDLCSLLDSVLCPLPLYNFVGYDVLPLPASVDLAGLVPSIAYIIPDLEAVAQLTLYDVETGELKACIQATLSNGWSTHQPAVTYATAALAGASLLNALWQSLLLPAAATLAPARLLDLISLYQLVAASAMLNLNYPVVYRSFALNFAWAFGLFGMSRTSSFENSIDHMRNLTGGTVSEDAVGGATALVNRVLSPYNLVQGSSSGDQTMLRRGRALADLFEQGARAFARTVRSGLEKRDGTISVASITPGSSNTLQAGIPIFAESINIATGNAFTTAFLIALSFLAISLALLSLFALAVFLLARYRKGGQIGIWAQEKWATMPSWSKAWLLRVALACALPLLTLGFYQWTLADSWLADLLAAITVVILFPGLAYAFYLILRHRRVFSSTTVLAPEEVVPSLNPIYAHYKSSRFYAFLPSFVATILRALFTAFAPKAPTVQISLVLATETLLLASYIVLRPARTKRADALGIYLSVTRLACTAASVCFLTSLGIKPIPRVAVGIVCVVIWSVAVVVLFLNLLCNLGLGMLWRRWRHGTAFGSLASRSETRTLSNDGSIRRSGSVDVKTVTEKALSSAATPSPTSMVYDGTAYNRAQAPTPNHHELLDPAVRQTYPAVTPTTTFAEPPTASSQSSYGVQMPSRWTMRNSAYSEGSTPPSTGHMHSVSEHHAR